MKIPKPLQIRLEIRDYKDQPLHCAIFYYRSGTECETAWAATCAAAVAQHSPRKSSPITQKRKHQEPPSEKEPTK